MRLPFAATEPHAPPSIMGARPWKAPAGGPGFGPGVKAYRAPRWRGYGDAKKLKALRAFVLKYGVDPRLRWFTVQQVLLGSGKVQQRDYEAQAAAILRYVQEKIYYTNEPDEQIQSPWVTLREGTGDCDDLAVLTAALAHSIRMPWRFVLAGSLRGRPIRWVEPVDGNGKKLRGVPSRPPRGAKFYHIYVELGWPPFRPHTWRSAEPTVKGAPLGHDPVLHGVLKDRHLRARAGGGMLGLAGYGLAPWGYPLAAAPELATEAAVIPAKGTQLGIRGLISNIDWGDILRGVVQSVIVSLVLAQIMRSRRRRSR